MNGKIDTAIFPYLKCKGKSKNIVLFDDMDKYAGKENVEALISRLVHNGFVIMATCKNGHEMEILNKFLTDKSLMIFHENMEIKRMDNDDLGRVKVKARGQKVRLNEKQFNGTVGSLFYPLDIMKNRFNGYDHDKRAFLRAVRKLYIAGIYQEREYSVERIKKICEKDGIKKWEALLEELKVDGFVRIKDKSTVEADEVYFQNLEKIGYIVGFTYEIPDENVIDEAFELFGDDADAMFRMGYKFGTSSLISRSILQIKVAIKANNKALKFYTFDKFPYDYALTQNNLGTVYWALASVEGKAANCKKAIAAYEEALKVRTFDEFPYQYATAQNNLGIAYWTLADVEEKAANCKKAIGAYEEALRVRTFDEFPYEYAMTQNSLGTAYGILADVEDKEDNCKKEIEAYKEALRVRTFGEFPYEYAMTQNNLGVAYRNLASVEDKAANCKKAIEAFEEALKVYTPDETPYDYEMASRNLARVIEFSKSGPDEAD